MKMNWISVNDRLPEHGEDVLVTDGEACMVTNFLLSVKMFEFYSIDWWNNSEVTHWMELPKLPK